MKLLQMLTLFIAFFSTNAFAVYPIKESRPDEDILFLTSPGGVTTLQGQVDGATGELIFDNIKSKDGFKTQDLSTGDVTVDLGDSLYQANPNVDSGHTYTINGTWNTVGEIIGSGSLVGTGSIESIDEQTVFLYDKTFQGDLTVVGQLQANGSNSQIKVKDNETGDCTGGNVCSGNYTTSPTCQTNCSATSNNGTIKYVRVGKNITLSGNFNLTGTVGGNASIRLAIPFGANFTAFSEAHGTAFNDPSFGFGCRARAISSTNLIQFDCSTGGDTTNLDYSWIAMYEVQ